MTVTVGVGGGLGAIASPAVPARPTVLVPTGSTEQHGPHLPLGADSIIATAVARVVAERIGASTGSTVLVAPTLEYGASGEHQSFAGTISLGHEALQFVLIELVRSLSTWAGRVVFVNGHGGNVPSLVAAVTQLIAEGHSVSWVPCGAPGSDAHAGRAETSLLLLLEPHAVDVGRAEPGNTAPLAELLPAMNHGGVASVSPNGVLGDPTGASATEGEELFEQIVSGVHDRLMRGAPDARGLLALPPVAVPPSAVRADSRRPAAPARATASVGVESRGADDAAARPR
ncbi:mycofactocin biosynthesis peptidyl-dipeptidase MftE [soil metagenome]